MVWVVVSGVFVFVGALIALILYLDKRRSDKIEAAARALGFNFRRKPMGEDNALITGCHMANSGHSQTIRNVLEPVGVEELRMFLFDYSYTIGYGKNSQTYKQTITRMQSPLLQAPAFALAPETLFAKIVQLLGMSDINFAEAPQFSKKYLLRGADEAAVRQLFTPALMRFLEQQVHLSIEAAGDVMFVYRSGRRAKPEQLPSFVDEGKRILGMFVQAQQSMPTTAG